MPRPSPGNEALKADFIAKKGITRCPPAGYVAPIADARPAIATNVAAPAAEPPRPTRRTTPLSELGTKPVLMWVPATELFIDPSYQRNISTKRGEVVIKDIVQKFQWPLFQPITITQREESGYWVIDGQHRMMAAKEIGLREIPAVLLDNLTPAQQALAFAGINGKRVSVNAYAIHHAMVAAQDGISLRLAAVCEKADISIPRYPKMSSILKPNETLAIAAMKAVMKASGDDALIWALQLIRKVYPDETGVITANAIRSLSGFYATFADYPIHQETMEDVLLENDPEQLREQAAGKASTSPDRTRWIVQALAAAYNTALPAAKARLPTKAQGSLLVHRSHERAGSA